MLQGLKSQFKETKETLKNVEENIKRITGRDPDEFAITATGNVQLKSDVKFVGNNNGFQQRKRPYPLQNRYGQQTKHEQEKHQVVDEESPDEDSPVKKPALQSTVVATKRMIRSRKDTIQEQNSDSRGLARNRRMFGFVLGTLQKFQNEERRHKVQAEKRAEVDKKVEEAAEKEKEQMQKEKQQMFITRREKQTQMRCLEKKMEIAELHEIWERNQKLHENFIRTEAKPSIMWLPAKMIPAAQKALEVSQKKVAALIKARRAKMEKELAEVDKWYTKDNGELEEGGGDENIPVHDAESPHDTAMLEQVTSLEEPQESALDNEELTPTVDTAANPEIMEIEDKKSVEENKGNTLDTLTMPDEFEPIYDE